MSVTHSFVRGIQIENGFPDSNWILIPTYVEFKLRMVSQIKFCIDSYVQVCRIQFPPATWRFLCLPAAKEKIDDDRDHESRRSITLRHHPLIVWNCIKAKVQAIYDQAASVVHIFPLTDTLQCSGRIVDELTHATSLWRCLLIPPVTNICAA